MMPDNNTNQSNARDEVIVGWRASLTWLTTSILIYGVLSGLCILLLPFGAYANGFQQITKDFLKDTPTVDSLGARRDLGPSAYAKFALGWVDQGATIVGGCCEVAPAHIAELAGRLRVGGYDIV